MQTGRIFTALYGRLRCFSASASSRRSGKCTSGNHFRLSWNMRGFGAGGVRPRFQRSSTSKNAPRHIKTALPMLCRAVASCFWTALCISSIVFFVVPAFHVVTVARRTVRFGYLERVFALRQSHSGAQLVGLCTPRKDFHFFCLM